MIPSFVYAQGTTLPQVVSQAYGLVQGLVPIVIGAGLLVFLWGVLKYVRADSADEKAKGSRYIMWGIVALFVMVTIWGLVFMLKEAIGVEDIEPPNDTAQQVDVAESTISPTGNGPLFTFLADIANLLQSIIPVLIMAGVLVFVWGVFKYTTAEGAQDKAKGSRYIAWGLVALLIMGFLWGMVALLGETLGIKDGTEPPQEAYYAEQPTRQSEMMGGGRAGSLEEVIMRVVNFVGSIMPVLLSLGTLFFVWGVFNYIRTENVDKKAQASAYIGWGLAILTILFFVWGFVAMIGNTVGINVDDTDSFSPTNRSPQSLVQ